MNKRLLVAIGSVTACGGAAAVPAQLQAPGPATVTTAPTASAASPADETALGGEVTLNQSRLDLPSRELPFTRDGAELSVDAQKSLNSLADYLHKHSDVTAVRLEGRASPDESDPQGLSARRAEAAREWLARRGVPTTGLVPVACGSLKRAGEQLEIYVADVRGLPYRGYDRLGGCRSVGSPAVVPAPAGALTSGECSSTCSTKIADGCGAATCSVTCAVGKSAYCFPGNPPPQCGQNFGCHCQ